MASNPEDLRALIDAYRKVCGAAITRYEGQVANYAAARDPVQERAPRYFDWHWIGRGEMVAIGLLTQLFLEKRQDELQKVVSFMALVGLPVELKQISFDASNREHVNQVIDFAMNFPFLQNEPFPVTREALLQSFMSVDELGNQIKKQIGDSAFLNLRAKRKSR